MCRDDEATEENLKKVNQFVEWFKELTGKDMGYSVRAKVITLHNDDDFNQSEDSYECDCKNDSNVSSKKSSECESCQNRHNEEKNDKLFLKVVRDVIEIPPNNRSFGIHLIDWEKIKQVCDIVFEKGKLICTNKTSGKGLSFNLNYSVLYCDVFNYFIGSFGMNTYDHGSLTMITWMDQFINGVFKNDYQLFTSYVLFYAKEIFHDDYAEVHLLENEFIIGDLKCTTNSIMIKDCHFIDIFYPIDESMFHTLHEKIKDVYEKVMGEKIIEMEKSLEESNKKLLQVQEKNEKKKSKIATVVAKIAKERSDIDTIRVSLKKFRRNT